MGLLIVALLGILVPVSSEALICRSAQRKPGTGQAQLIISSMEFLPKEQGVTYSMSTDGGQIHTTTEKRDEKGGFSSLARHVRSDVAAAKDILRGIYAKSLVPNEWEKTVRATDRYTVGAAERGGLHQVVIKIQDGDTTRVVASMKVCRSLPSIYRELSLIRLPHISLLHDEGVESHYFAESLAGTGTRVFELGGYFIDERLPPEQYRQVRKALWTWFHSNYLAEGAPHGNPYKSDVYLFDVFSDQRRDSTMKLTNAFVLPNSAFNPPLQEPHYILLAQTESFKVALEAMLAKP